MNAIFPASAAEDDREEAFLRRNLCEVGDGAYCEVASSFYATRDHPVPEARRPAFARLGYNLEAFKDNYAKRFTLKGEPPLAEFMLRSLYESFLDDPYVTLTFTAPMVKPTAVRSACAATSQAFPAQNVIVWNHGPFPAVSE